ncbi:deoxynucleoside triphosphate triphosphohydrolase SAMHD1-like isoform X2 [Gordionus sp. m RMFG-2023]|uniref:deoxynucleoside triphosphate triphosphohydrolase SAMHD1-like isoform X2 n=1 Tax=Gordionus sp. m RMFG-2023 TaxID=3053472 RepID=UPI0031FDD4B0
MLQDYQEHDHQYQHEYKVFNDSIHGHIEMHPLCVQIIDTPEFQRLRAIRQLGGCYWVFPGAANNRFEHSLGVSYLAGQLIRHLQTKQPELNITEIDILCIEIAGLCHDLGHGPFSHLFDRLFLRYMNPESTWTHEKGSIDMLRHIHNKHEELKENFCKFGIEGRNFLFILELIAGPLCELMGESDTFKCHKIDKNQSTRESKRIKRSNSISFNHCVNPLHENGWKYLGRDKEKSFLYEIVANHKTGVDVDKWDYFARDCHHLGIKNSFDHNRLLKFTRVINDDDGFLTICFRDKEAKNLYDMFHTRDTLHRKAYKHRVSNIIELMITEALALANDYIFYPGIGGQKLKMTEAINDMVAYTHLTDFVYYQILNSDNPNILEAKKILERIENRKLYKYIGRIEYHLPIEPTNTLLEKIKLEIILQCNSEQSSSSKFKLNDIALQMVEFDYGMEDENPLENVRFYTKENPNEAKKILKSEVSNMLPENFTERYLTVYSKNVDNRVNSVISNAFSIWCSDHNNLKLLISMPT